MARYNAQVRRLESVTTNDRACDERSLLIGYLARLGPRRREGNPWVREDCTRIYYSRSSLAAKMTSQTESTPVASCSIYQPGPDYLGSQTIHVIQLIANALEPMRVLAREGTCCMAICRQGRSGASAP